MTTEPRPPRPSRTREGLVARRTLIVSGFAAGGTWLEVGRLTGLSQSALAKRLHDPTIRREINEARAFAVGLTAGKMGAAGGVAVEVLLKVARDDDAPHMSRVQASRALLEIGVKYHEADTLNERLTAIERRLDAQLEAGPGVSQIGPGASCDIRALTAGAVVDAEGADDPTDAEIENEPEPPEAA